MVVIKQGIKHSRHAVIGKLSKTVLCYLYYHQKGDCFLTKMHSEMFSSYITATITFLKINFLFIKDFLSFMFTWNVLEYSEY